MNLWSIHFSFPAALAVVAALGYLVGRRNAAPGEDAAARSRRDVRRTQAAARELEKIAWMIRRNLSRHHSSLARFKQRLGEVKGREEEAAWRELCREAEQILTPTLRLSTQIATAYDQIRQQTGQLMAFAEVGTDPLTGVGSRHSLDEALASQMAMWTRYEQRFSLAVFDIDHFKQINDEQGNLQGDQFLQRIARLLDENSRETDVLTRYGGEEFVVLMPLTDLEGAAVFSARVRQRVEEELRITVSAGIATVLDGDDAASLLQRADAALSAAKKAGRNRVFRHTGSQTEPVVEEIDLALSASVA